MTTVPSEDPPVTRYVVVVHGIGKQRKNETVLPVIHRFAEARALAAQRIGHPITRGMMASHLVESGSGDVSSSLESRWIEFEGIPADREARRFAPFIGRRSSRPGADLRFVDMHWSSVMEGHFKAFGESPAVWTQALIDRLENRDAPRWILEQLHTLRRGLLPLHKLLSARLPGLTDEIFSDFLGDVQLYGEYLGTRGTAVRRFHERMAGIEALHYADEATAGSRPRYTIIAHSLGSIMSFDALVLAHMHAPHTPATARWLREILPEYQGNDPDDLEATPSLDWIANVDSFVTLGSPIDKFLLLWWLNYEHLAPPGDGWIDPERLRPPHQRIRHYNYCDAQDPVGHELDVAYSETSLVRRLFERVEDRVFTRYSLPGVAHVDYWTDRDLFRRILDTAVDGRPLEEAHPVKWFRRTVFLKALVWSYLAVPFAGWLASSAVVAWTLVKADSRPAIFSGLLVSLGIVLGTLWVTKLMIEWRGVLIEKEDANVHQLPASERGWRAALEWLFRILIVVSPAVWSGWALSAWSRHGDPDAQQRFETLAEWLRLGDIGDIGDSGKVLGLALAIAVSLGLLLSLSRLGIWLWVKLRWGKWLDLLRGTTPRRRLEVDFEDYLATDPTRPDPIGGDQHTGPIL